MLLLSQLIYAGSIKEILPSNNVFMSNLTNSTCLDIGNIPIKDQCQFAKLKCQDYKLGSIDYFNMYYCGSTSRPVRNLVIFPIIVGILIFLFVSLGIIAGEYLCPNLSAISNFLRIPDNISGMTLLAFGNDSPDIMSTYTSFKTGNAPLAIGELIGAAFFVTCFVIGTVSLIHPFSLLPQNDISTSNSTRMDNFITSNAKLVFVRDICFFFFTIVLILAFLMTGSITKKMLSCLVIIYSAYATLVVVWQLASSKKRDEIVTDTRARALYDDSQPLHFGSESLEFEDEYTFNPAVLNNLEFGPILHGLTKNQTIKFQLTDLPRYHDENESLVNHPESNNDTESDTSSENQSEPGIIARIFSIVAKPIFFVLGLTTPLMTIDSYNKEYNFKFSELIYLLSSLISSQFIIKLAFLKNASWFTLAVIFILSVILATVVYGNFIRSKRQSNVLKIMVSTLGFLTAISWISLTAEELINNLKFISVLTQLSEAILGLTIFAVGNSVGDLISDIVIAKLGYPLMALAACLGGPLMNMLLSIGGNGLIAGISINISMSANLFSSCLFILMNLIFMLFYVSHNNWSFDHKIGMIMIATWFTGTFVNVLIEVLTWN